jgi:hypothetical protein
MNEQKFLQNLRRTARQQAVLPASHNRWTAFFWRHAWMFWLLLAVVTAWFYELGQGRC